MYPGMSWGTYEAFFQLVEKQLLAEKKAIGAKENGGGLIKGILKAAGRPCLCPARPADDTTGMH